MAFSKNKENDIYSHSASTTIDKIDRFIDSIICPSESVYYAAEYLRLQSEVDVWKTKFTKLEEQLNKRELENVRFKANLVKEWDLKLKRKLNEEKMKLTDFFGSKIQLLKQKNIDLKKICDKHSQRIKMLRAQLKNVNVKLTHMKSERLILKPSLIENLNKVKSLQKSELKIKESLTVTKAQLSLKDRELNKYKLELQKIQADKENLLGLSKGSSVVIGKCKNMQQLEELARQKNNSIPEIQTEVECEIINHQSQRYSFYQPILSPVTPATDEDEYNKNGETENNDLDVNMNLYCSETMPESPPTLESTEEEHYEVFANLFHELALNVPMCVCGNTFHTAQSLQEHLRENS